MTSVHSKLTLSSDNNLQREAKWLFGCGSGEGFLEQPCPQLSEPGAQAPKNAT